MQYTSEQICNIGFGLENLKDNYSKSLFEFQAIIFKND